MSVRDLERVLSPEGWPYASSEPVDADDPGRFHALFGRDSLITSLQLLPERPDVARATLRALAALQGVRDDPETDEEPGKIVHEYRPEAEQRFVDMGWPVRDGELRYYGSADGTSWFLVLLDALGDTSVPWQAAAEWLERALEQGGGLVRHGPRAGLGRPRAAGLAGHHRSARLLWRRHPQPDGSVPEPPLADADTQAVAVAALRAVARLSGDSSWDELADRTVALIAQSFTPDLMAVNGGNERVDGGGLSAWVAPVGRCGSRRPAPRLRRAPCFARHPHATSASARSPHPIPSSRPEAYHRGAVWPFDSWLGWGGLRAAGFADEAERVRTRRAGRARPPRRRAGALRGHGRRAAAHPNRQPGPGLDGGRALGAEHGWDGRDRG